MAQAVVASIEGRITLISGRGEPSGTAGQGEGLADVPAATTLNQLVQSVTEKVGRLWCMRWVWIMGWGILVCSRPGGCFYLSVKVCGLGQAVCSCPGW